MLMPDLYGLSRRLGFGFAGVQGGGSGAIVVERGFQLLESVCHVVSNAWRSRWRMIEVKMRVIMMSPQASAMMGSFAKGMGDAMKATTIHPRGKA